MLSGLRAALQDAQAAAAGLVQTARHDQPPAAVPGAQPLPDASDPGSGPGTAGAAVTTSDAQLPPPPEQRCTAFEELLGRPEVDLGQLRVLSFNGVPEVPGNWMRSLTWQLLLGSLPPDRSAWRSTREEQRCLYRGWKSEFIVDPSHKAGVSAAEMRRRALASGVAAMSAATPVTPEAEAVEPDAHPLTTAPESAWSHFFKNEELFGEIEKDVSRTLPDYGFYASEHARGRAHRTAILHILFVYARLNPGIRYVQGMNELLAPLYYLILQEVELGATTAAAAAAAASHAAVGGASSAGAPEQGGNTGGVDSTYASALDPAAEAALGDAEADVFFTFTNLMAETRDFFCQSLDHSNIGVTGAMRELSRIVALADPEVAKHLSEEKVSAQFYGFRWITLLLTQEFDLPDVLRIWDSFFADEVRFRFVLFWCVAMLIRVRDQILSSSFADIIKLLQHYPDPDIAALHHTATALYDRDRRGVLDSDSGQDVGVQPGAPGSVQWVVPATSASAANEPVGQEGQVAPGGLAAAAAAVRRVTSGGNTNRTPRWSSAQQHSSTRVEC